MKLHVSQYKEEPLWKDFIGKIVEGFDPQWLFFP